MSVLNIAAWSVIAILLLADISVHLWSIKVSRAAHKALELTQSVVASMHADDSQRDGEVNG
jgi:hypothetical protein